MANEKEVPSYKATSKGFAGKKEILKGATFDYEGVPGKWMEPLNAAAKAAVAAHAAKKASKDGVCKHCGGAVAAQAAKPGASATNVQKPQQVKDDPNTHGTAPKSKGKADEAKGSKES